MSQGSQTSLLNPSQSITSAAVVHITIPVSTKLDRTNFLTWRSQIEPIVDGYDLSSFLDESVLPPDRQIPTENTTSPNPAFLAWRRQDRLLLGWLRSTITGPVLSQYISCQTSASLWSALHRVYSAISSARIMELRRLLQITVRGGKSCNGYFEQMREIVDQLTACGEPVADSDLVRYILNGLGSDFNSFVVAVTTRSEPLRLSDLHGFLLTHESLLTSQHQPLSTHTPDPVALHTQSSRGRGRHGAGRGRGSSSNNSAPLLPTPMGRGNSGPVQGRGSYSTHSSQGRGGPNSSSQLQSTEEKLICQVCFKRGHTALIC